MEIVLGIYVIAFLAWLAPKILKRRPRKPPMQYDTLPDPDPMIAHVQRQCEVGNPVYLISASPKK